MDLEAEENLVHCVEVLESESHVTSVEAKSLLAFVRMRHPFVMAAYDVYLSEGNIDDLMDTLLRIASRIGELVEDHE